MADMGTREASEQRKIASFNKIAELFYNRNFGQAGKTEIELLMFHLFMEECRDENKSLTDYSISKSLGITQQRVRNLKIKEQLAFPRKIEWENELSVLMKKAKYDAPYIVVDIPDPNIMIEIKNYLEEKGMYVLMQRNSRLLTIRIESYLELVIETDEQKNKKAIYNELIKRIKRDEKYERIDIEDITIKSILDKGVEVTSVVANLLSVLTPGNVLFDGLRMLVNLK